MRSSLLVADSPLGARRARFDDAGLAGISFGFGAAPDAVPLHPRADEQRKWLRRYLERDPGP